MKNDIPSYRPSCIVSGSDAAEKIAELEAEIERLRTPHFYWDDRHPSRAIEPGDICEDDPVGTIVELRPLHELPSVFAVVTEDGVRVFETREEAAEAAAKGGAE